MLFSIVLPTKHVANVFALVVDEFDFVSCYGGLVWGFPSLRVHVLINHNTTRVLTLFTSDCWLLKSLVCMFVLLFGVSKLCDVDAKFCSYSVHQSVPMDTPIPK